MNQKIKVGTMVFLLVILTQKMIFGQLLANLTQIITKKKDSLHAIGIR
jgi:hypothetical protein